MFSAWFVYGPQALDDYKHGVYPAYQFAAGLPLELPDYRSPLLVWVLGLCARLVGLFGVHSALGQVRSMYIGLAMISLLAVVGTYHYARVQRSRLLGALLVYLTALFPLMPFVGTRAFGEAVALAFVTFGFGLLEEARHQQIRALRPWLMGFLSLGVATLFRYHAGLLFVSYAAVLIFLRLGRGVLAAMLAGIITLAAQLVIDALSGRPWMGTLLAYLAANEGGAAQYGVSPWYNTWAFASVVLLAPFSFVLFGHWRALWSRQWPVLASWVLFVLAHSLVPHKE